MSNLIQKAFDEPSPIILAVLGRGSQRDVHGNWVLTQLFETCDDKGAHLPMQLEEDDENPYSCIGGGEINLQAGVALYHDLKPALTVFAFGMRSKYLVSVGGPSESQVMTRMFHNILGDAPVTEVFDEIANRRDAAGTDAELENIFRRAVELGIKNVAIVTVAVHIPRTALMAQAHLGKPEFAGNIVPQIYPSELILETANPLAYSGLFAKSVRSLSFERTFEREIGLGGVYPRGGVNAFLAGIKHTASSLATAAPVTK